jgi:hypothetical protein
MVLGRRGINLKKVTSVGNAMTPNGKQDESLTDEATALAKQQAIDATNTAIKNTPEMIAAKKAQEMLLPGAGKQFDEITDVSTYANKISANNYMNNLTDADKTLAVDLGWINYYRKMFKNVTSTEGEDSYFNYYSNMFNRSYENYKQKAMNNVIVKTTKNAVENAIAKQTQTLAETFNLVKPGEDVLELDSKELDERIDKLQTLIKDPDMQKHIAETAQNVTVAMKEPLKDAVSQLTSLMADFSKDATEQGMLALGNAVKIIPVAGNIISAVDLVNNVEKLSSKAVESANKTLDIASDVEFNTSIGLKKQEIEKMEGTEDQINEKIQILNDFLTEEMKKSQKEIDDLNKQINDKTGDEDTIKKEIYNLETKNKEIEGQKMDRRRPSPASNVETVSQKGGAKMIKAHINTSKQTLKRVNKCLKDHFNKCVTRKSPYSASKKKRDKRIVNKTAKKI